tara:strand:- start:369 stop:530 length:162 start_codon:yes stop_codon:yes gene_type:complete
MVAKDIPAIERIRYRVSQSLNSGQTLVVLAGGYSDLAASHAHVVAHVILLKIF